MSRKVGTKNKRKVLKPNPEMCGLVEMWSAAGVTQQTMFYALKSIDPKLTLAKFQYAFKDALKDGGGYANTQVIGMAWKKIMEGNVPMIQFWLSRKCGWHEVKVEEISGRDGAPIKMEATSTTDKLQRAAWVFAEACKEKEEKTKQLPEPEDLN